MATSLCTAHKTHTPRALTVELHHVIPVAWQQTYTPPAGTADLHPGVDGDGRGHLWDARTVALCPTGHRNVHACIVALMHGALALGRPSERVIAQQALGRFTAAGGSLDALRAAHEWGIA